MKKQEKVVIKDDLIPREKLDLWIKEKLNVLFQGRHGVGKTHIILKAFKRAGLRYAYFSGATMDPFVDFLGIPVKVHDSKTGVDTIKMIRPEHLVDLDAQAFFFDEFNRTHKKIRNAVMELMQFKTLNGKPIATDLQIVWAAVNPDDDEGEYDVDRLDPAQKDRFQVQIEIPFKCSVSYFKKKYGDDGATAVLFWNRLDPAIQALVSPRRLDYALSLYQKGGDLRDALPIEVNPGRLAQVLKGGGYEDLDPLLENETAAEAFFAKEANYAMYIGEVLQNRKYNSLIDTLPDEKVVSLLLKPSSSKVVKHHIKMAIKAGDGLTYAPILNDIKKAKQNGHLAWWAKSQLNLLTKVKKAAKNKVSYYKVSKGGKVLGANSKSVLLAVFNWAVKQRLNVTVGDLEKEYQSQMGRIPRPMTIANKVSKLAPWLLANHKLKIVKVVGSQQHITSTIWQVTKK